MKGKAFNEALFNAAIQGNMTQFCEIMKPQPYLKHVNEKQWIYELNLRINEIRGSFKPKYKLGETVYLKEDYELSYDEQGNEVVKYLDGEIRIFKKNDKGEWYYENK